MALGGFEVLYGEFCGHGTVSKFFVSKNYLAR